MTGKDRRRFRRLKLTVPISRLGNSSPPGPAGPLLTKDISAGGMYFQMPADGGPAERSELFFELTIPPGEGYSTSGGRIEGTGQVIRTTRVGENKLCVAVRFTQPLSLNF